MTVSTTTSQVTIQGNGATTVFSFSFTADDDETIYVQYTDADEVTVTLDPSVYTLALNAISPGDLWPIGGTVTYPLSGSPISSGTYLTIVRDVPLTQTISIGNQGAFYPQAIEQALDLIEMQLQQVVVAVSEFGPADPTATAGPDAVIGSAVTFMRSDSAPAIQLGSTTEKGLVQADGTTISVSNGVISAIPSASNGNLTGNNRLINGDMKIDQRNTGSSQTFTAGSAIAYCVDQWYASCATTNITGQRVAGTAPYQYAYKFTGAASNSATLFGQRIESINVGDLASTSVACQAQIASSSITSVTWTAYYANASNNFSAKTSIATGTITINSTPTIYYFTFNAGANAGNGIAIEFTTGALVAAQTLQYSGVQLERGSVSTPYQFKLASQSETDCRRYWQMPIQTSNVNAGSGYAISTTTILVNFMLSPGMRVTPTIVTTGTISWTDGIGGEITTTTFSSGSPYCVNVAGVTTNTIARQPVSLFGAPGTMAFSALL